MALGDGGHGVGDAEPSRSTAVDSEAVARWPVVVVIAEMAHGRVPRRLAAGSDACRRSDVVAQIDQGADAQVGSRAVPTRSAMR